GPTTFCRGSSVTLTASGANTYTWSPGDGLSITTGPTVIATPEVTTSYVVTGTGANGCTGNAQVTVTVNQRPEGIMSSDPAVCSGSNSGTVNLTIADGSTVIGWESSTNAGTTWSPYTPLIDQYTTSYLNLTQTTVYRALLQLNGCQAYSSIGIIPVNNVLEPVVTVSSSVSCLNTAITLHASGYGQPPFPVEDFQRANPVGWSGDDAGSNNEDPNSNWALTTNGKTFNGINYNSQATPTNSKFIIVTGVTDEADHNATITAPPFSLVGTITPTLSYYTALNFNAGSTGTVEISTDGGTTFTDLITYTGPRNYGNPDGGWINVTYSLVPYINQPDVRIRFNYTGTAGSNWGLDNIGIISTFQPIVYHWTPLDHMTPPTGDTPDVTVLPDVGLHTYCVSSTTAAGCESDTVCITVNVLPLPDCNITGTDGPVCPSSVNSFTAPAGMSSYSWTISGNGRITAGANAQNVIVTSGTGCNLPFTISSTITDNNGCVSTCSKTVLVQDITPPIISCPVISAQYRMDNGLGYYTAVGTEFDATAIDNCTVTSITHNLAYSTSTTLAGYHFPLGSTTVTWTATDACGLTATCQIIVTVIDDQPPAITCPPPIIVQCAADVPVPYVNYSAFLAAGGIATDNNQINPALFSVVGTDIITNQSCANRYTITRTYQVNDLSGNSASCTQAITVNDQTAPVITGCPANQIFCETPTNVFTIPASISAGDNCGGAVDITYEITGATTRTGSGNNATGNFNIGGSTITWTATDVCGNVATCSTTVTINPRPVTSPIYHR
ncbi:MAG TPA: HYR domain-containing protein, partial [Bacteroidales bacterium]|nr:HYR domain-containing protein [Bacteroidales bacterium]